MKRLIPAIITFCLMLSSCNRQNDSFVLNGTVQDSGMDSILVFGLDSNFDRTDTIYVQDGLFTWSFMPDTVTTLILTLSDGRQFPVFAEKKVQTSITIPSDTGQFILEGGTYNDAFYSFYKASYNDSTLEMISSRIDSFIVRDPFSEVTPYLLYEYMVRRHHASPANINALIGKMSGNMQDSPFLIGLKSELKENKPSNTYLTAMSLRDSTGKSVVFSSLGTTTTYVLCCLWGSWNLEKAHEARLAMKNLADKYKDRELMVIDLSIDVNFDRWKREISKDTLGWVSYIDTKGWESMAVANTGIHDIPTYIVFSGTRRMTYHSDSINDIDIELDKTLPEAKKKSDKPLKLKLRLH